MTATGKTKTCVWRWRERFVHMGVDGLLRDRADGLQGVDPHEVAGAFLKLNVFWLSDGARRLFAFGRGAFLALGAISRHHGDASRKAP